MGSQPCSLIRRHNCCLWTEPSGGDAPSPSANLSRGSQITILCSLPYRHSEDLVGALRMTPSFHGRGRVSPQVQTDIGVLVSEPVLRAGSSRGSCQPAGAEESCP